MHIALLALTFSFITVLPEVVSLIKHKVKFSPIMPPPNQIGDDYHYFTLLNVLSNKVLGYLCKNKGFSDIEMPKIIYTQIFGHILNLPAFILGMLIKDKRIGVILVRVWNRFLQAVTAVFLGRELSEYMQISISDYQSLIAYLITFLVFPLSNIKRSIIFNLWNGRHIFQNGYSNEMTRAMFSETVTPYLFLGIYASLLYLNKDVLWFSFILQSIMIVFLAFIYFPAAISLYVFQNVIFFFHFEYEIIITNLILVILLYFIQKKLIRNNPVTKSLIRIKINLKKINIKDIRKTIFLGTLPALYFWLSGIFNKIHIENLLVILVGIALPVIFTLPLGSHLGRIWGRSGEILYNFFIILVVLNVLINNLRDDQFSIVLGVVVFAALTLYQIYQNNYTLRYNVMKLDDEEYERLKKIFESGKNCVSTDSLQVANHLNLYTNIKCALRDLGTQNNNYEENIRSFVKNFLKCDWSEQKIIDVLTKNIDYKNWTPQRPIAYGTKIWTESYIHTIQYWMTNREYNAELKERGLHDEDWGWTKTYEILIKKVVKENKNHASNN